MASAEVVDTPEEAREQELEPLIVREPLARFLDSKGLGGGTVEIERIGEGHSNVTFLVTRSGERFVLRRPPRGPLPPSAHDVLREARLIGAVVEADVRTPRVLATCDDESVIGAPFYVMAYEEGVVITSSVPPALDSIEGRRRICCELVDALAEMHAVDWRACGLEGFGKPTGYLDRQLRRFKGLWEHNKTRELPLVQEVGKWLAANKPQAPPPTIVHRGHPPRDTKFAPEAPAPPRPGFCLGMGTIGGPPP